MPYGDRDLEAWKEWKSNPSPMNMQRVLDSLDPLIQNEVNRWSGTLARPLLELEAKKLAAEAVESYLPNMGASLGTHVTNRLKKLSRITYTHQNVARMPEYQTLLYNTYRTAEVDLEENLGRPPTAEELAERLAWSKSYMNRFQKSIRKELIESGEPPPIADRPSDDAKIVDYLYNDLSNKQKTIFQHTTGYAGSPIYTNNQLMKKLDMTQGQLSYQKKLLVDKIKNVTGGGL